jgi:hypothetical protein
MSVHRALIALLLAASLPQGAAAEESAPPPAAKPPPTALPVAPPPLADRVAIAELASPPAMLGMAGKLGKLVTDEATKAGTTIDALAVGKALGAQKAKELAGCGADSICVAMHGSALGAKKIVTGQLDKTGDAYTVKLWLHDLTVRRVAATLDRKVLIASRRFERDVQEALPAFLAGKADADATLSIEVEGGVDDAKISVDGAPAVPAPLAWSGAPGKHKVRVTRDGYYPVERFFEATTGVNPKLSVKLLVEAGKEPPPSAKKDAAVAANEGGGLDVPTGSWIAGGVGAGALLGGVVFGAMASGLESDATEGPDGVLAITRQDAQDGGTYALTANVLFGVAALGVGAGVALFLLDDDAPATASLSPTTDGFAVTGSF